ncbi:MAG: protein kinase [Planctomycetes bacterium]|nr:protein kinase [Planctomycetota bacterium]
MSLTSESEPTPADCYRALWENEASVPDVSEYLRKCGVLPARDIVNVLLVDQAMNWRDGTGPNAEEYFGEYSKVFADPELRLEMIWGELRARSEHGLLDDLDAFLDRFPGHSGALRFQLELEGFPIPSTGDTSAVRQVDQTTAVGSSDSAPNSFDPDAPLLFEDFRLEKKLGAGAMGEVHRAIQLSLNKPVAVKLLGRVGRQNAELIERFLREARAVASLRHPNIVNVHGIGQCGIDGYFLVMDLIDGPNLEDRLQDGPLPIDEAVAIVQTVARAIDHAHSRGVVHRDLKPSNVMLDEHGQVIVTDFGLAKNLQTDEPAMSATDQILGTPRYMAPEQALRSIGEIAPTTDVYGLGALLYALLVGKPPYEGDSSVEILSQVISQQEPIRLRKLRPEIPVAVEVICMKCLRKNPTERYATARELEDALGACVFDGVRPESRDEQPSTTNAASTKAGLSRRQWMLGATVAAMLIIVPLAAWLVWFRGRATTLNANVSEIKVEWTLDVFRNGQRDQLERPTTHPAPLYSGDSIRLRVALTDPAYAYVYWIGSDQSAVLLYPKRGSPDESVSKLTIPLNQSEALPVSGPAGTEVCLLVLRNAPLENGQNVLANLAPSEPFPPLDGGSLVIDGEMFIANAEAIDPGIAHAANGSGRPPRQVGPAEPLEEGPLATAIARWKRALPSDLGTLHYLAIPHLNRE